jgi:L-arabinokinase
VPVVVFYVSGHGFGHASRDIEVINALLDAAPGVRVEVRTSAPRWLFDLTVRGEFGYEGVECDVGVVQHDSLRPDLPATVRAAERFYCDLDGLVRREASALRAVGAALVVSDMPPLAFEAAARAGIPSVGLGNFTWDWIYAEYVNQLGEAGWLPGRIREAHALALEAIRLPMHGGFGGFRHIVDVPLVARRSRRDRPSVREALGAEDGCPMVLSSFGGVGLETLDLGRLAGRGAVACFTTATPGATREAGAAGIVTTAPDGVHVIDERALYARGYRYEDVVLAADVVVTKPGYGIIAECIANGTPLLYTSRGRFAEYDVLVREMPRFLRCAFIDHDDLLGGTWEPHVERVLAQPAPPERPRVDGAEVAAARMLALLEGRRAP